MCLSHLFQTTLETKKIVYEAVTFSVGNPPKGWTTTVRLRVMGYKVTPLHLPYPHFHLTAGFLIASQGEGRSYNQL